MSNKPMHELFKSKIPEGQSGDWRIEKFEITESEANLSNVRAIYAGYGSRRIIPGKHTRLMRGDQLVMSDTFAEIRDHMDLYLNAEGHILLAGLGLGVAAKMAVAQGEVKSLTIIENSVDVIKLVAAHLKLKPAPHIFLADIFTWKPHERFAELGIKQFDYAWFDIWDDFNEDFIAEKQKLYRRYGRWAKVKANWLKNYFWEKA